MINDVLEDRNMRVTSEADNLFVNIDGKPSRTLSVTQIISDYDPAPKVQPYSLNAPAPVISSGFDNPAMMTIFHEGRDYQHWRFVDRQLEV
jgi:hypothetical protein